MAAPNLTGKVAIVTGANNPAGIGFNTVRALALKGVKTYVGARSLAKGQDAVVEMERIDPSLRGSGLLAPLAIDLSDLKEVRKVGHDFAKKEGRLDILIHNAALMTSDPADVDANGIRLDFVVNNLSPFVLTQELMPLLRKTAKDFPGVRVVNISSEAHASVTQPVRLDDIESFNQNMDGGNARYGLTKLANILFSNELQRHFDTQHIQAVSVALHPGRVATDGALHFLSSNGLDHMIPTFVKPTDGTTVPVFAATSAEVWTQKSRYGGKYLVPPGVVENPSPISRDAGLAKELWEACERVTQHIFQ